MCFSPEASFVSAAILIPAGAVNIKRAYTSAWRYLPISAMPLLLGLQQFFEGFVWTGNAIGSDDMVRVFSMAYMLFAWLVWPIWLPFSTYFLEPCKRKYLYLLFAIVGGVVGGIQYIPYYAHEDWLVVRFFDNAISYQGTILFDLIMPREITNAIYVSAVVVPLLTSSMPGARIFGMLVLGVILVTFLFFQYAYISAFCFGAGVMSLYLVYLVFRETAEPQKDPCC